MIYLIDQLIIERVIRIPIISSIIILVLECDDSFIYLVSIILISIQLCTFFSLKMPSEFYCPRCKSEEYIEYEDHIECLQCGMEFSKESLEMDIDIEDIAAEEELQGFFDGFDEEERKKLEKILKEDNFS
ncbi:MAG: hypothetical protein ACFFCE_17420 [Promethearchaeota archaeon]